MILAGFSYDPKICNFKFQNEFKMKLFRGFQGIIPTQFKFYQPTQENGLSTMFYSRECTAANEKSPSKKIVSSVILSKQLLE